MQAVIKYIFKNIAPEKQTSDVRPSSQTLTLRRANAAVTTTVWRGSPTTRNCALFIGAKYQPSVRRWSKQLGVIAHGTF